MQEAYLIVDYERSNFTVAQAAFPDPLPDANVLAILPPGHSIKYPTSDPNPGLSTGAKAGIAVGCAVLALLLVALSIFLCRRRRQRRAMAAMGAHGNASELGGIAVSEVETLAIASPLPHKASSGMQELCGTPRSELAGPLTEKPCVRVNDVPQELETTTPSLRMRFEQVTAEEYNSYRSGEGVDHGTRGRETEGRGSNLDSNEMQWSQVSSLK